MKTMFVPLDGSDRSETVLPLVIALARNDEHSVTLFSVRDSGARQLSGVREHDIWDPDVSGLECLSVETGLDRNGQQGTRWSDRQSYCRGEGAGTRAGSSPAGALASR